MTDKSNYSLLAYNTFGIEAQCSRFVEFDTVDEAVQSLPEMHATDFLLLGGGSNILLTKDYQGTVIHSAIKGIDVSDEGESVIVRCGSGENWDHIVDFCVTNGYHGAENLSLIPGDAGASAVQNIGAYGAEVKDIITSVEAVEIETGRIVTIDNAECQYAYRHSRFKTEWKNKFFITHVSYRMTRSFNPNLDYGNIRSALAAKGIDIPTAAQVRETVIEIRQSKLPDPAVQGNAGSFFMNPIVPTDKMQSMLSEYPTMPHYTVDDSHEKIPAGWMIEQCGWKGRSLGRAGVHDRQALVLVNRGGATGEDILRLCTTIQHDVESRFGIVIRPEVNII